MFRSNIKFFLAFFLATMLFAVVQAYAVWQDAPAAPAQYGVTQGTTQDDYKPINLGSAGQQKLGNFVLGTTTASLNVANLSLYMPSAGGLEGLHITRSSNAASSWSYLNIEDQNSSPIFKVHQNGNVGIGTAGPNSAGVGAAPVLHLYGADPGIKFGDSAGGENSILTDNGNLRFFEGTSEAMRINTNGYVGIGTTDPGEKLHISGGTALFDNVAIGSGADINSGLRIVAPISTTHYNWMIGAQQNIGGAMEFTPSNAVGGAVGGTTFSTPSLVVHQNGNINIRGDANATQLCIAGDCKNSWGAVTGGIALTLDGVTTNGNTTSNNITVSRLTASDFYDRQDANYYINPNGATSAVLAGKVGIGTTDPGEKLHISGGIALFDNVAIGSGADINSGLRIVAPISTTHYNWMIGAQENYDGAMEFTPSNAVGGAVGGTTFSTPSLVVHQNGNITVGGSGTAAGWYVSSDARLKNNVETLSGSLDKIGRARGVSYNLTNGQLDRQIGVIAQELEQEFPELVRTDDNGYKSVAYDRLSAVLIEAIKELRSQNQTLQQRLDHLEKKW